MRSSWLSSTLTLAVTLHTSNSIAEQPGLDRMQLLQELQQKISADQLHADIATLVDFGTPSLTPVASVRHDTGHKVVLSPMLERAAAA